MYLPSIIPINTTLPDLAVAPVRVNHAGAYSATHFHLPDPCIVERAASPEMVGSCYLCLSPGQPHDYQCDPCFQGDAKAYAAEEQAILDEVDRERRREVQEQREKARLRHKHALQKEILKQVCLLFCSLLSALAVSHCSSYGSLHYRIIIIFSMS